MADVTHIYGNEIVDAAARQDVSQLKEDIEEIGLSVDEIGLSVVDGALNITYTED